MSRTLAYCILTVAAALTIAFATFATHVLSDENKALSSFVEHELIATMGVILAITLASITQLHLTFNKIEEDYKKKGALSKTRAGVRSAAYGLIALFFGASFLALGKTSIAGSDHFLHALFNGASLVLLLWTLLILIAITETIFAIPPKIDD